MNLLSSITAKCQFLRERDRNLAYKYIKIRDFNNLHELVESSLVIVEKNLKTQSPKPEYLKLNIGEIESLLINITKYIEQIEGSLITKDIDEDEEDEILEEEY